MNSSNFFVPELEEMKICTNCAETSNNGVGLQMCWLHLLLMLFEKTELFFCQKVCKIPSMTNFWKHYPMLTLQFAGLRVGNSKSVIVKNWNTVRANWTKAPILQKEDAVESLLERNISTLRILSSNTKFLICNRRHSFSQSNEFSNVFQRKSKVQLQSQCFSIQFWVLTFFSSNLH